MSDLKQVKVDNWGIYFLQRLKHFFNRTDYCDLTLQFQDNAQLKVHRLVLNACTEYFELLERTCEMYEDCLIMPDDLQADVVVPIVNFMYTGQLEFKMDILEKLYQTSQIMNMPVLTKLLDSHRVLKVTPNPKYNSIKRYSKPIEMKSIKQTTYTAPAGNKRSYSKAFDSNPICYKDQTVYMTKPESKTYMYQSSHSLDLQPTPKRSAAPVDPRPTRYELPEELDTDNVFDNSFTNISYTSQPLMVHPDSVKQYTFKRHGGYTDSKCSGKNDRLSLVDIVECKKMSNNESNIFDDSVGDNIADDSDMFDVPLIKSESGKVSNQLFDQILGTNNGPKVTIEAKDSKSASNIDHAKIISEVLKKYPHLVKSNKVIKLKVLNTPTKLTPKKQMVPSKVKELVKPKVEKEPDFTYEVDVLDSKEAAKLIALGAENIKGPWICLICGTPGKALHFTSYLKFRRHLVDVHNEKPVMNICEYCGMKSAKRNCLLHHLYSKHGVQPPPSHHFPKCNQCSYIGLTEALLIRHKLSHTNERSFRCNVCDDVFSTSNLLLQHIQCTGHKYSAEKKTNLQCIYCLKVFLRQTNLYAHIKINHREEAKKDGIIDDSDDEKERSKAIEMKYEPTSSLSNEYDQVEVQYNIQQRPDDNLQSAKKQSESPLKQKILNSDFSTLKSGQKSKSTKAKQSINDEFVQNVGANSKTEEDIVMIDNNEYIVRNNLLIPKLHNSHENNEFIIPDMMESTSDHTIQSTPPTTSMEFTSIHTTTVDGSSQQSNMIIKNSTNLNQPIQIVVSNEEEYKALMSSNHPIIFDNGDASKTLTVLTAPHATSLGTIDLNTAQSNEMMIIQEDYPLNTVSEAVATDNSNIVVVYSHHIDQDKQYQLLAPEGINEQFVPTSAIITQNYETISTSTPVMSAHVLDTPVEATWQQDNHQIVQNQQVNMNTGTEINTLNKEIHTIQQELPQTNQKIINTDISELPVVNLQLTTHKSTDENEMEHTVDNNLNQNKNVIVEHLENIGQDQDLGNITSIDTVPMEIDHKKDDTVENEIDTIETTESSGENNTQEESSNIQSEMVGIQNCDLMQPQKDSECTTEQISVETVEQQENIKVDDVQISVIETSTDIQTNEIVDKAQNADDNEIPQICEIIPDKDSVPAQEAQAKIQTFTAEWSEDEYDSPTQTEQQKEDDTSQDENGQENVEQTVEQNEGIAIQPKVVESIENIQREIENQIVDTPDITSDAVQSLDNSNSPKNVDSSISNQAESVSPIETNGNVQVPQENISSILNDWDDNDSQEDKDTNEEAEAETSEIPETQPVEITKPAIENSATEKSAPKPDLKSLVSDWDDDDEEETKT